MEEKKKRERNNPHREARRKKTAPESSQMTGVMAKAFFFFSSSSPFSLPVHSLLLLLLLFLPYCFPTCSLPALQTFCRIKRVDRLLLLNVFAAARAADGSDFRVSLSIDDFQRIDTK